MASSRIFVRGIPPSVSEDAFRRHFSKSGDTTDVKIFPNRRIGYVGYKSPEDAAAAVKYFNKTFMKMSRLAVELARPVSELQQKKTGHHPTPSNGGHEKNDQELQVDQQGNTRKRKRKNQDPGPVDPKLEEYLKLMMSRGKTDAIDNAEFNVDSTKSNGHLEELAPPATIPVDGDSDQEYEALSRPKRQKGEPLKSQMRSLEEVPVEPVQARSDADHVQEEHDTKDAATNAEESQGVSDADWLRSRTSRLLGLLDEDEEEQKTQNRDSAGDSEQGRSGFSEDRAPKSEEVDNKLDSSAGPQDDRYKHSDSPEVNGDEETIRQTGRLFLRNLSYNVSEDDLRDHFSQFGSLDEVHVPMDKKTGKSKGLAYLQYIAAGDAVQAYRNSDGHIFKGRLLHVLPAAGKRGSKLDEFEISKLPLKKQNQIRRKAGAAKSSFSWNSLYMNADAVMSSVSDRLGIEKSKLLDPTSSDAAVKQALAETHVIQETKAYFLENGVDLEAFKRSTKGDVAILAKNFPYGTKPDELRRMFEEHGQVLRMLMPPSGTIAIVEFANSPQARSAFASMAYRKMKDSVLFLEWAPKDLFKRAAGSASDAKTAVAAPAKASELLQSNKDAASIDTHTLYVRNLNFATTSKLLADAFKPLDGFLSATVKTKTNPKKPQEPLSMGYGFLEFRSKAQAQAALAAMDGHTLDGHQLVIKASQRNLDAGEERRREDQAKRRAAQKSKIVIKNLAFETSKKDLHALLQQYGQLRTVRVPRKFDSSARGFAFAEFTSPQEATSAMEALRNTHLLGRPLVMEYAEEDTEDAEAQIEKMAQRVADKTDKVELQKLVGGGRRKFDVETAGVR